MLTYLDGFEEQLWEVGDDTQAQARVKQAVAAYKGGSPCCVGAQHRGACLLTVSDACLGWGTLGVQLPCSAPRSVLWPLAKARPPDDPAAAVQSLFWRLPTWCCPRWAWLAPMGAGWGSRRLPLRQRLMQGGMLTWIMKKSCWCQVGRVGGWVARASRSGRVALPLQTFELFFFSAYPAAWG